MKSEPYIIELTIIIEKVEKILMGRVMYEDDLIVAEARTEDLLKKRMKDLLKRFHSLDANSINFTCIYENPNTEL